MRVLYKEPGKEPEMRMIDPTVLSLESLMGGEVVSLPYIGGKTYKYFIRADSYLLQLPVNLPSTILRDEIRGPLCIVRYSEPDRIASIPYIEWVRLRDHIAKIGSLY